MAYPVQVPCSVCGRPHTKQLPNKSSAVQRISSGIKKVFCSVECRQAFYRSRRLQEICKSCGKTFPVSPCEDRRFCSRRCYYQDMHNNPEEYNSYQRSQDMRNKTDKKKATQKMIDTKVKTGQIVNPKNLTWKQFWKKCNRIVFKKRKDLLKSWNGYDYLDGEYIYKYLDLPYFHKNYPTLDHIIPKQKFFLSGKSPEEACRDENLGWTKRTNNSRKHVKEHGVFLQEISDLTGTTD